MCGICQCRGHSQFVHSDDSLLRAVHQRIGGNLVSTNVVGKKVPAPVSQQQQQPAQQQKPGGNSQKQVVTTALEGAGNNSQPSNSGGVVEMGSPDSDPVIINADNEQGKSRVENEEGKSTPRKSNSKAAGKKRKLEA